MSGRDRFCRNLSAKEGWAHGSVLGRLKLGRGDQLKITELLKEKMRSLLGKPRGKSSKIQQKKPRFGASKKVPTRESFNFGQDRRSIGKKQGREQKKTTTWTG